MESIKQMILSGETQFLMSASTLIALIVITSKVSSYLNTLKNKLEQHDNRLEKVEIDHVNLKEEHQESKLTIAVLKAKLDDGIDLGIQELKQMYKDSVKKK